MSAKAGKRPLRSLTAHEKLDAIRRVHDGESKASVARDIGVPESTLRGWCKNEDKISYLSRQSSPETDDSIHGGGGGGIEPKEKKMKVEENLPFNLSLKPPRASYSPTSEPPKYPPVEYNKTENDTPKTDKFALNLNTKPETPKSTPQMSERERNRAELARLSVELGLNRPEMFMSNANTGSTLADLSTNIGLLAQWNSLLIQQQQQQQQQQQPPAAKHAGSKKIAPADTTATTSLYAKPDQKPPKLPKMEPPKSVEDSVWYWLKTQQAMLGLTAQTPPSPIPCSTSSTQNGTAATTSPTTNGGSDQNSSWFWKWYKQFAAAQQSPPEKPILYQQLTKDRDAENQAQAQAQGQAQSDERPTKANVKARAVLDNLLLNNNNNVTSAAAAQHNKRGEFDDGDLTQAEAVEHGEKFLKWLECCSEPSVSAVQIMQFKSLLNNIKNGADRKNGDHNKAKVKRK